MREYTKWCLVLCVLGGANCYVSTMPNNYDTIVVGLGSAGVTAASTLANAGRRVLGLEAQDRIGGRVMTVPFGDGVVEVGAEWIHGTEGSRVYQTAIRNNVSVLPQDLSFQVYMSDGSLGNKELVNELIEFCLQTVEKPPEEPEALGKFITRELMKYINDKHPELLNDKDFIAEFLEMMNLLINNYEASNDWNDVSAQTNYEELAGHQHTSWHRHGYKTFFEILLNTYNNGTGLPTLDIKLNKEVTLIKWPKNATGNVQVVCKDGDVYTASNVIVTVSLGVLKERYSSLFSPPIPEGKITSINKLSIGVIGKIILSFPEKWWNYNSYLFFWKSEHRKLYSHDDYWVTKLQDTSFPAGSSNTMTFWTSGDTTKLVETLPEDVVKRKAMELLRKFMGKNMTIPEPTDMIRSTWFSNPFTRGSYTHDNLLMHEYPNARAILGEPLVDDSGSPKVLFAGEATDLKHFSTVHGASDSGFREAMRLLPSSKV
ncbi:spermine oxidase-like isoform X2 [Vanessa atalanta]|uniref:spermine oxidase-like isoform X2 n=1 Tax=Vanessa atalanta TaxID=42275 RepID=UPI001FCD140B|nr:spermine oxidase-like isoform X2 [Vanessa atalanta]